MVEVCTIEEDRGRRCACCGRDLYRQGKTWWIARHGEYCSRECASVGAAELEAILRKLDKEEERYE